ncbi:MAG: Gfo/Idh/MocA family oxidoreductase [Myxococcota bacterium]
MEQASAVGGDVTPIPAVVIGVGHLGKHHARIYKELPDSRLVGVVDASEDTARTIGKQLDVPWATSPQQFMDQAAAFSVVVPTVHHFDVARPLLDAGKHVLIEKPMVLNLEQARELHRLSAERNLILQVGHIERFNSAILAAKEHVKDPRFIEVHRLGPFPERATDVGVTLDLMIHDIDIILSLVNSPVTDIRAMGARVITRHEDIANARLEFANGCVANLTASRLTMSRMRKIRIFQGDSYISIDYAKQSFAVFQKKVEFPKSLKDIALKRPRVAKGESLKREISHFLQCIRSGREPVVGPKEGADALAVALQIVQKIHESGGLR